MRHFALSVVLCAALFGCTDKQDTGSATAPVVDLGKSIAETQCAGCHGLDGRGVTPEIPHLAAQFEKYLLDSMIAYKEGTRTHAALHDLTTSMSETELRSVVSYYASRPPLKTAAGEVTWATILSPYEKGKAAASVCAGCHNADGNSNIAGIPNLAGQQPLYLITAVREYLDGSRKFSSPEKQAMVNALNRLDIESMVMYYASQTPAQRPVTAAGDATAGEPLSASCGSCHGLHGVSHDATIPSLAAQDPQYLIDAITAYRDGVRKQDDMHQYLAKVRDENIANIATFYATQSSRPAEALPPDNENIGRALRSMSWT